VKEVSPASIFIVLFTASAALANIFRSVCSLITAEHLQNPQIAACPCSKQNNKNRRRRYLFHAYSGRCLNKDFPSNSHLQVMPLWLFPTFAYKFLGNNWGALLGPAYLSLKVEQMLKNLQPL